MFKSLVLLLLTFVFFTETIGVQFYRHSCRQTGDVHISWFHCEEKHESKEDESLPACCKKNIKNCCDEEFSYLTLKLEYEKCSSSPLKFPQLIFPSSSFSGTLAPLFSKKTASEIQEIFPPPDCFLSCSRFIFYRSLII